jgi:ubiquinone/menaquinone biosynthesis C-methylase UbiE
MLFTRQYWDDYYKNKSTEIEWYDSYESIAPVLEKSIGSRKPFSKGLHLGCGTSKLGNELVKHGWVKEIINIDYSDYVVKYMSSKYSEVHVSYEVGDATNLSFSEREFDFIIDKGLLDSILSTSSASTDLMRMFTEIKRVQKSTGVYIVITPNEAHDFYFRRYGWQSAKFSFPRRQTFHNSLSADSIYYFFVMTLPQMD